MHFSRQQKIILGLGFVLLSLTGAIAVRIALARPSTGPVAQASPLHPTFKLLDQQGDNVLESGQAVSTMQTCGECHDAAYIAGHSFHTDLGFSEQVEAGQAPSG